MTLPCGCVRRDLDALCQLAKDVVSEPRHPPAQRYEAWLTQARGSWQNDATTHLLDDLASKTPAERYQSVVDHARKHGLATWRCAQLQALMQNAGPNKVQ